MRAMSAPKLLALNCDFLDTGSNASVVSPNCTLKLCAPPYEIIMLLYYHIL
jgi:hypothetical protein